MRIILSLILCASLFAGSWIAVLPLYSIHDQTADNFGRRFNSYNIGVGARYEQVGQTYLSATIILLNDSYKHPFLFSTIGLNHHIQNFSVGIDVGVGYKNITDTTYMKYRCKTMVISTEFNYKFIPVVAFSGTYHHGRYSFSISHAPSAEYQDNRVVGVTLFSVGYKL